MQNDSKDQQEGQKYLYHSLSRSSSESPKFILSLNSISSLALIIKEIVLFNFLFF